MKYHRTPREQLEYLEAQLLSGDGVRCKCCGDVRHINDMVEAYDFKICTDCAEYQALIDDEEREAREEMGEHGKEYKH